MLNQCNIQFIESSSSLDVYKVLMLINVDSTYYELRPYDNDFTTNEYYEFTKNYIQTESVSSSQCTFNEITNHLLKLKIIQSFYHSTTCGM